MNPQESHATARAIEKAVDGIRFDRTPSGKVKSWGFYGAGFASLGDKRLFFREKDGQAKVSAWVNSETPLLCSQTMYRAEGPVADGETLADAYIRLVADLNLPVVG